MARDIAKKRAAWRAWYHRSKSLPAQQEMRRERRRSLRHAWKAKLTEIKVSRGCATCGERHPACLDFHHVRDKVTELAAVTAFATWEDIEKEIEKCVVLCSNCHLKEHVRAPSAPVAPPEKREILDDE